MEVPPHPISLWITSRAPAGTAVATGPISSVQPFDAAEAVAVKMAVRERRDEFHTGRRLARSALVQLGCPPMTIPIGKSRVPVWPRGFVGTISHSRSLCVAHVGRASELLGLGIDIQPMAPLAHGLETLICRPDEDPNEVERFPLLRFVAKEAFYKAYFSATGSFLEFQDVRVDLDPTRCAFLASLMASDKPALAGRRNFEGCFTQCSDHLVAALWVLH